MIIFDDHLWRLNTYFNSILSFIIAIKYANVFLILSPLIASISFAIDKDFTHNNMSAQRSELGIIKTHIFPSAVAPRVLATIVQF